MNYIGMDAHIATLDFAVINERGKISKERTVKTGVKDMIEYVRSIPKPRKIYTEEGSLATWLLETCNEFGETLIITDPKRNKWIGKSEQKYDRIDARKLGELARGGYIKEIYHAVGKRKRFCELVSAYHDMIKSQTRIKNKLKAKFRQHGIRCSGETVYGAKHRDQWRKKLDKEELVLNIVEEIWHQLDSTRSSINRILKLMRKESKNYPEIKNFQAVPGIGFINAVTISAIIETPNRFSNKKKVWMYAGLGIVERGSGEKIYSKKLSKDYNRMLKRAAKSSMEAAIGGKDNQFRRQYLKLTLEKGVLPHRAKLTVARSLLAALYGMWKNGEKYDPTRNPKNADIQSES
ncbi:MAG: IS110 family transposase [Deltaproteobacteria bacterium]|nr:IS110 family transposase [Deltaproteobacteria bacterium]MBT6499686.1 IS110 family transposase [Deltaproteobacteria bacterium]